MHNNSSQTQKKIAVLIVAAGKGMRVGGDIPKQYRMLGRQSVLAKTIEIFSALPMIKRIAVAIQPDAEHLYKNAISDLPISPIVVCGGHTRSQSVKNGLLALKDYGPDFVLVHDAARPFASEKLVLDVIAHLEKYDAVAPALPIVDALKTTDGKSVAREQFVRVQTPQGFNFSKLLQAYGVLPENADLADDIALASENGMTIGFSKGDPANIKLTYEDDFKANTPMRSLSAIGFDVHKVCPGAYVYLAGVKIDAGFSLKGHSDADVALHAITDAILGGLCAGDIGEHFPPSDPKWKGAASDIFLQKACELVAARNAIIDHIDLTLICEQPKISPHKIRMREKIAEILSLSINQVSVKATTTEGLGLTGRNEGIAAQAICTLRVPDD